MKNGKRYTPVWNGLWHSKHIKKMGNAVFLFGFLLSRANKKGLVRITYKDISNEMKISVRTLGFWMHNLKNEGYLNVKISRSMEIQINNFRSTKQANLGEAVMQDVAEPKLEVIQDLAEQPCKTLPNHIHDLAEPVSVHANKQSVSLDSLNKRINIDKKKGRKSKIHDFSTELNNEKCTPSTAHFQADKETAIFILGKIQNIQPGFKYPNLEKWANDVRLLRERDGRTHESIKSLFIWANNHHFWQSNILCPSKLREKWDQLEIQKSSNENGNGYRNQAEINSASSGEVVI